MAVITRYRFVLAVGRIIYALRLSISAELPIILLISITDVYPFYSPRARAAMNRLLGVCSFLNFMIAQTMMILADIVSRYSTPLIIYATV